MPKGLGQGTESTMGMNNMKTCPVQGTHRRARAIQHTGNKSAGNRQKMLLKIKTSSLQGDTRAEGRQGTGYKPTPAQCNKTYEEQKVEIIRA